MADVQTMCPPGLLAFSRWDSPSVRAHGTHGNDNPTEGGEGDAGSGGGGDGSKDMDIRTLGESKRSGATCGQTS